MYPEANVTDGPERLAIEPVRIIPPPAVPVQPPVEEIHVTEEDLDGDDDTTAVEDPPGPVNFI